jgi:hypothetical protein
VAYLKRADRCRGFITVVAIVLGGGRPRLVPKWFLIVLINAAETTYS